jgi:hypothetical protein
VHFALGIFYTTLFCIILKFFNQKEKKEIRVSASWLIVVFIIKVAAGIVYGYLYSHYYTFSDSWEYFKYSLVDYDNLLHQPAAFFSVGTDSGSITQIFSTANNSFWNNAGSNMVIKLLAVLDIFSFGNYYVSSILFNVFSFTGLYLIYKTSALHFKENRHIIFILVFLFPSNLFWSSGIAKEGLIVFFTGVFIYEINALISVNSFKLKNLVIAIIAFCGIFLMRSATALIFVPAIVAWYLAEKVKRRKYLAYIISYSFFMILFFLSAQIGPVYNMPLNLANKQHDFLKLEANTTLPLTQLQPTLKSYAIVFPQALNHIFLRPYPNEITTPFHLLAFIENMFVLIVIIICLLFAKNKIKLLFNSPFSLFILSVAITGFILVGYTVPFTGAIIRYKALFSVFFLLAFLNIYPFLKRGNSNER